LTTTPSFLTQLAQQVIERAHPERCLVILPSQRAVRKFERSYAALMKGPGWLPTVHTLGMAIQHQTTWIPLDGMEGLALLYSLWKELPAAADSGPRTFEAFMPWGRIALRDFNEIDQHLLDAQSVFQNLCDIEGIEDWSFGDPDALKPGQKAFLRQYLQLGPLYAAFTSALEDRKQGYAGLLARQAASHAFTPDYDHIFVGGMSALTPAELQFLKGFERANQLTWAWDGDASYVQNEGIEAGMFIREQMRERGAPASALPQRLSQQPPALHRVNCSSVVTECQYIREAVAALSKEELARTAIVLPDASQLPLLLQSLPEGLQKNYNVTMGLAWSESPACSFLRTVHRLVQRKRTSWHHDDIRQVLSEPLLHACFPEDRFHDDATQVLNRMAAKKWAWVSLDQMAQTSSGPVHAFFEGLTPMLTNEVSPSLSAMANWVKALSSEMESNENGDPWTQIGWEKVAKCTGLLRRFQANHGILSTPEEAWNMLFNSLQSERIDLLGEPEEGLQIMGLIESRALDYERIFLMDCNEGTLPKSSLPESFIPFDLRHMWGLPGRHQREAIYAYYTYRLMNRCKEIHFLYRGQDEAAEPSRYLLQFERSFRPNGRDLLSVNRINVHSALPGKRPEIQPLEWTPWAQSELVNWAKRGISPSAWNTFMACKRDFYYKYILRLHEQDEFEDEMTASTFGTIVHKVLEDGFKMLKSRVLKPEDLEALRENIRPLLHASVEKEYSLALTESGENYLHFAIAEATLRKLINVELMELQGEPVRTVTAVEAELDHAFGINGSPFATVRLHGKADRIDLEGGEVVVTDYKTGSVKESELALKGDWLDRLGQGKSSKALQLLIYSAIALETLGADGGPLASVQSGIRSGKNAREGLLKLKIDGRDRVTQEDARQLLGWLVEQLEALHGSTHGLEHETEARFCAYCTVLDPLPTYFN
jgi:hypothetical protein